MKRFNRFLASNLFLYVIEFVQALRREYLLHKRDVFTVHTTSFLAGILGIHTCSFKLINSNSWVLGNKQDLGNEFYTFLPCNRQHPEITNLMLASKNHFPLSDNQFLY